jgi:hypothetical protein
MTQDALLLELEATRATLRRRDAELESERAELARERAGRARHEAQVERLKAENADLKHRIDVLARRMFGRSSERLTPGQYLLAFEAASAEAERAIEDDARETALGEETERTPRPRRRKPSAKPRQQSLPVRTQVVEPNTDDTGVTYLLKPRGRASGAVWTYVGERGEVAYDFTENRSRDGPAAVLRSDRGYLQADALKQYDAFYASGEIVEVACWAHARRYLFEALSSERALAEDMLERSGALYEVERHAKALSEAERLVRRQEQARPILKGILAWLEKQAPAVLPKGPMGQAIAYATKNWASLTRYLEQGYLAIDNNAAERALRSVAVGRKNWLFAGSADAGRRAAVLMTLVNTCKLQGIDPQAYLADVLVRVATTPVSYEKQLLRYTAPDLLIVDDVGLRPLDGQEPIDLYEVIRARYERGAMVLTSNRAVEEWYPLFRDELMASAAMDRLLHRAHVVVTEGHSFRNPPATRRAS